MPTNVRWSRALITPDELLQVRYLNDDYWIALSGGSRLAVDAAARIRQGLEAYGVSNAGFWYLADALAAGAVFPALILVGEEGQGSLVVLEGHARLTAYTLRPDCLPPQMPVLAGYARGMAK